MKKNAKHWWEIFQRSPHKQKKPYILYYTFGKEKFSYYGKAEHTTNIWKHKLKHKNQSSPAHISSHLCGKDLGNCQFNPVEKKEKEQKSCSQEDVWPAHRQKANNQQNKNYNIHIWDWCSLHYTFSHLNSCYQMNNTLSLAGYHPTRYIYPNPNRNFLTIRRVNIQRVVALWFNFSFRF